MALGGALFVFGVLIIVYVALLARPDHEMPWQAIAANQFGIWPMIAGVLLAVVALCIRAFRPSRPRHLPPSQGM
jgi:hypothetical protein